jgi:hypothetical protein
MSKRYHPNTPLIVNYLLLGLLILGAQFVVLTHTHDAAHPSVDVLCKVCISGEHLGHALIASGRIGTSPLTQFFHLDFISDDYVVSFFTHALARAPPGNF